MQEIEWEDTTPIEIRVERLRGAMRTVADAVLRLDARSSKQQEILDRVDEYVARQEGGDQVRKATTAWIRPVVSTLMAGIVAWAAVTIWGARTAPAAQDVAAEVVKMLAHPIKVQPPAAPAGGSP